MFEVRTTKPKNNKYYITIKSGGWNNAIKGYPVDKEADVLANCVGYANGRFAEIQNKGIIKYQLTCNAEDFIYLAKSKYGLTVSSKPVLGGIMVWQGKGAYLGHVAIVEKIISDNEIYTSESSYGTTYFFNATRNNTKGNWSMNANFKYIGCIVNPEVKPDPPTPPVPPKPKEIKVGDSVIVNGYGFATSFGEGARTRTFKNQKMKVIAIVKGRKYAYALNQYNKGKPKEWFNVTAWFKESDIKLCD